MLLDPTSLNAIGSNLDQSSDYDIKPIYYFGSNTCNSLKVGDNLESPWKQMGKSYVYGEESCNELLPLLQTFQIKESTKV